MSATPAPTTATDLDCTLTVNATPSREPMGWWAACSCGHRTPMVRSRVQARDQLVRLHRTEGAAA